MIPLLGRLSIEEHSGPCEDDQLPLKLNLLDAAIDLRSISSTYWYERICIIVLQIRKKIFLDVKQLCFHKYSKQIIKN